MSNRTERLAALIAAGIVDQIVTTDPCEDCASEPDVCDGYRKAPAAKYRVNPANGIEVCGKHVLKYAEGREYIWNPSQGRYVAKPAATKKARPVYNKDQQKRLARPCQPTMTYPGFMGRGVCQEHHCTSLATETRCTRAHAFDLWAESQG